MAEHCPHTVLRSEVERRCCACRSSLRLGTNICEPHDCICGQYVNALGTHGLACKRSAGRHPRHSELNDTIWRALQRAQIPSTKEPKGLSRTDHKRQDGVTMIPWAQRRCLRWDVTSPDTLAAPHLAESAVRAGSAAAKAEVAKTQSTRKSPSRTPLYHWLLNHWEPGGCIVSNLSPSSAGVSPSSLETHERRATLGNTSPSLCRGGMPSRAGGPCLMNWTIADFLLLSYFVIVYDFLCFNRL